VAGGAGVHDDTAETVSSASRSAGGMTMRKKLLETLPITGELLRDAVCGGSARQRCQQFVRPLGHQHMGGA